MVEERGVYDTSPSLWRCSGEGRGIEVRTFHEDSDWVASVVAHRSQSTRQWEKGQALCPRFQAARAYQFATFVKAIAQDFDGVQQVELVADYKGLAQRNVADPNPLISYSLQRRAMIDGRRVHVHNALEGLAGDGITEAAAELIAPFFRLFDGWEITSHFVRSVVRHPEGR